MDISPLSFASRYTGQCMAAYTAVARERIERQVGNGMSDCTKIHVSLLGTCRRMTYVAKRSFHLTLQPISTHHQGPCSSLDICRPKTLLVAFRVSLAGKSPARLFASQSCGCLKSEGHGRKARTDDQIRNPISLAGTVDISRASALHLQRWQRVKDIGTHWAVNEHFVRWVQGAFWDPTIIGEGQELLIICRHSSSPWHI
jgi:hypothetical protein